MTKTRIYTKEVIYQNLYRRLTFKKKKKKNTSGPLDKLMNLSLQKCSYLTMENLEFDY